MAQSLRCFTQHGQLGRRNASIGVHMDVSPTVLRPTVQGRYGQQVVAYRKLFLEEKHSWMKVQLQIHCELIVDVWRNAGKRANNNGTLEHKLNEPLPSF